MLNRHIKVLHIIAMAITVMAITKIKYSFHLKLIKKTSFAQIAHTSTIPYSSNP